MKVAFITRSTLYSVPGGDTVQVLQTAKHINLLGINADIKLTNENINYNEYNLLHFFNITRPSDILYHTSKTKKPFVISTIFIDYSQYDKYHRQGIAGMFFRFLSFVQLLERFFGTVWIAGLFLLYLTMKMIVKLFDYSRY